MKKLNLSNIQEGVRKLGAVKALFEYMESSYTEAMASIVYGLLKGSNICVSMYGCVNSGSGSNYNISAGAIFNNGEVYTIAAFAGAAGAGQVPVLALQTTNTQLAYTDNTNQNTLATRVYVWQFGASGSGIADFSGVTPLATVINNTLLDVPGQITTAINAVIAAAPGALNTLNELAAALANDPNFATTITNLIAAESATRANADTTLQNNINAEAATRGGADTTLQNNINAEATTRANADTTLQNNINAEATARANADTTLQNNINAEASARGGADTTLQNNIDAEAAARAAADNVLQVKNQGGTTGFDFNSPGSTGWVFSYDFNTSNGAPVGGYNLSQTIIDFTGDYFQTCIHYGNATNSAPYLTNDGARGVYVRRFKAGTGWGAWQLIAS
jgi:hypothetical protein